MKARTNVAALLNQKCILVYVFYSVAETKSIFFFSELSYISDHGLSRCGLLEILEL